MKMLTRPTDVASAEAVKFAEKVIIRRMLRVIEKGAMNATLVNDDGLDDKGQEVLATQREKRIAMDMRKSRRNAPTYIDVALRRVESAEKADALRASNIRGPLNIGVIVQVTPPSYPTLDVTTMVKGENDV